MSKEDIVVKLKKVQDELIMDDGLLATDNLSVVKDESDCIVLDFSREIEMIDEVLKEIVGQCVDMDMNIWLYYIDELLQLGILCLFTYEIFQMNNRIKDLEMDLKKRRLREQVIDKQEETGWSTLSDFIRVMVFIQVKYFIIFFLF